MKPIFPPLASILFIGITIFIFGAIVQALVVALKGIRHPNYTSVLYIVIFSLLTWLAGTMILSQRDFFADFHALPPKIMFVLPIPIALSIILVLNRSFKNLIMELPPQALIYVQSFRIVVEIVLWLLYRAHICPEQMTFEGWNFDILAGLSAPIIGYIAFGKGRFNKNLAIIWNFIGIGLLLTIILTAILSIPQIGVFKPENTFIVYWPMVWLPSFVAPFAFFVHVVSLRQLFSLRKR